MSHRPLVRVYLACSLDGFIAGPDDDLSWLSPNPGPDSPPEAPPGALQFEPFLAQAGAMLMGRRSFEVVQGFGQWPYGDLPVLLATRRPLNTAPATVRAVQGDIGALIADARAAAGDKDVYVDGGDLVRQALDAGLVDELCITVVPTLLTAGIRLFEGLTRRQDFDVVEVHPFGRGWMQYRAVARGRR